MAHAPKLDLAEARARLEAARGKDYWRSLEELAQSDGFQELLEREFPRQAGEWTDAPSRRQFLTLMAASLGLAGLSGCAPTAAPRQQIMPYVRPPEEVVPGRPLFFATTMTLGGDALGLLVESHEGRPTKIEGNPDHPATPRAPGSPATVRFGATNVYAQASVLSLYDPDRAQTVAHLGNISTWDAFTTAFAQVRGAGGELRLRVLTETVTSPTLAHHLGLLRERFPAARWHVYEPVNQDNARAGARLAFGQEAVAQYQIQQADVILALDADFLSCSPGHVRHLHDFALRRRVRQGQTQAMNRLYVVESTPSGTGAMADHRLPLRSADVEAFARALAARLDARFRPLAGSANLPVPAVWMDALASDVLAHRGRSLVLVGDGQPPVVHALAHTLNDFLGNVNTTVVYSAPVDVAPPAGGSLRELVQDLRAGQVDALVILGGNPVYTAPADLDFAGAMNRERLFRVHLGLHQDETSDLCHWHLPEAHFLEAWGDARCNDGTVSFIQPLIAPLYGGKSALEVVALLVDPQQRSGYDLVRGYWRNQIASDFETWWREALRLGKVTGTALPPQAVTLRSDWMAQAGAPPSGAGDSLEIVFRPDPTLYDGRFANNGWLQELPKPLSKITWDNAAYLSPATAVRLGLAPLGREEQANEKVVELTLQGRSVPAPVWVLPGHADNSVTVHLGHGRTHAGRVGTGRGFDAYQLRMASAPWFATALTIRLTDARHSLATTQHHFLMEGRDLIRSGTVQRPPPMPARFPRELTLYDEAQHAHPGNQWAMVIDLNVCTGCSACVVACQAENNIPVVGKDQVLRGREMHWLRIDHYYQGPRAKPQTFFQPVPCMHCENAPCELVCPVGATVHSRDGLNDMVYNRCVGTRYCSNNCPYKVRRFNFFQFADWTTPSLQLMHNPDVTVRSRGVMEKCTYCVQRIRAGQIAAQLEDRSIRDGEVVTACQAACPAGAITFGDFNDRDAQVARLRSEPLHYALLEELNTRPRTTYLAALKNPNPDIARLGES